MNYSVDRDFFPHSPNPAHPLRSGMYIGILSERDYRMLLAASCTAAALVESPGWVHGVYAYFNGGLYPTNEAERNETRNTLIEQRAADIRQLNRDAAVIVDRLEANNSVCNTALCSGLSLSWVSHPPCWLKNRVGIAADTHRNSLPAITDDELLAVSGLAPETAYCVLGTLSMRQFYTLIEVPHTHSGPEWAAKLHGELAAHYPGGGGKLDLARVREERLGSMYQAVADHCAVHAKLREDMHSSLEELLRCVRLPSWRTHTPKWLMELREDADEECCPPVAEEPHSQTTCPLRKLVQSYVPGKNRLDVDALVCHARTCSSWLRVDVPRRRLFKNCADKYLKAEPDRPADVPASWEFQPYSAISGIPSACRYARWREGKDAYCARQRAAPTGSCLLLATIYGDEAAVYRRLVRLMSAD